MAIRMLTAEHAVIHTAAVEVKTLTISGKQVTLSTFRQLPEREIVDWEAWTCGRPYLQGDIWGIVRYYWGDFAAPPPDSEHRAFHIIWQHGDRLCRRYLHTRGPSFGEAWDGSRKHWCFPIDESWTKDDRPLWRSFVEYTERKHDQLFIAV